jgi:hypothetical protein
LTSNRYEDSVAPELQLETAAYGSRYHGDGEEVLLDLRLAAELYSIVTDASGCVRCPDYSRDLSIKEKDIDAAEKACRES